MGMILIYGLIFLLIFFSIGIGLFIYSRKKKSKVAMTISVVMILLVISALLTNTIDELTISKKDIITDLKHIDIELKDDFKITNNKVTGMPERIQETKIQITQKDRDRIISEIRNSTNFKSFTSEKELANDTDTEQFCKSDKIFNFKYPEFYSREIYTKIDNFPTRLFMLIYDNSNTIEYQRIEE
jgi:cbb3-type cytochrome oxidase subunit 3